MSRILPILFNTEMVRAILDGRKTVTRRICRDGNDYTVPDMDFYNADERTYAVHNYADKEHAVQLSTAERSLPICPGDTLYVRETWGVESVYGNSGVFGFDVVYKAGEKVLPVIIKDFKRYCDIGKFFDKEGWIPSLFMPKEAARIWLKVTAVRAERLQNITEEQAKAEGAEYYAPKLETENGISAWNATTARTKFCSLWDSTCKKTLQVHGWNANPWVWVYEFERCEKVEA